MHKRPPGSENQNLAAVTAMRRARLNAATTEVSVAHLEQVIDALVKYADEADKRVEGLMSSQSWRLTSPLRRLIAGMRGQDFSLSPPPRSVLEELSARARSILRSLPIHSDAGATNAALFPCRTEKLFIFTGVPFDDIGGGQRAAQLARVALARGERVVYVYAYQKWEGGRVVESDLSLPNLEHLFLDRVGEDAIIELMAPGDTALFELPHRRYLPFLEAAALRGVESVFELIDAWDSSLGGDWFSEEIYQKFIVDSDRVVGTAKLLQKALVERGRPDAAYLPNAFNEAIFDCYRIYPKPSEFVSGARAVLYFGSLYGEWFDWDALYLAARQAPDSLFYLIGDSAPRPEAPSNVLFLGGKLIDELPAYLQHSDVAILPFKPGHISDAVSPIKVFEYLAMGVPVVSLDLPEIRDYPNVHVARSPEEFAALCAAPLPKGVDEGFLMRNSWGARLDLLRQPRSVAQKISVIVLIHNNEKIIARCLDSLLLHTKGLDVEIIVVDNASLDSGPQIVESMFPGVKLIRNPKNGCSSGRNLGVAAATGDVFVFLDSDQWLTTRGAFEEGCALLYSRPDLGAVGWAAGWFTKGNENYGGPIVDYLPGRGTQTEEYLATGVRTDIAYLGSGGLFVPREVFERVGGFDESYDPTCFEDTDFSLAIKALGLKIAYRNLQGIRHQAHQTTGASQDNSAYQTLFRRNADYFGSKWRAYPEFFKDLA